ncbi:hypothetical protein RCL1_002588 [Eukaryota sp. TZLM3-RCL]
MDVNKRGSGELSLFVPPVTMSKEGKVKAHEIRQLSKEEIVKKVTDLKGELLNLRVAKVTSGGASKMMKIRSVRKSIARCLTILNTQRKHELRKQYRGAKYVPIDLRPKLTRALRKALSPEDKARQTLRAEKKAKAFPMRRFALRA